MSTQNYARVNHELDCSASAEKLWIIIDFLFDPLWERKGLMAKANIPPGILPALLPYSAPNDRPLTVNPSLATMAGRTWPP
jgi:hypothetical protein